jgi:hypothetical protein
VVIREAFNNNSAQHEQTKLYTVRATLKILLMSHFRYKVTEERGPISPPRPNTKIIWLSLALTLIHLN